jgi:pSer/pThr/pTyr-binding forkhead associated (FHA) protein
MIVGRAEGAGLRVPDSEISSEHCKFELVNGRVVVADLDSTNGTSVNGIPVHGRQKVESGDIVSFGRAEFRVHVQER